MVGQVAEFNPHQKFPLYHNVGYNLWWDHSPPSLSDKLFAWRGRSWVCAYI